MAGLFDLDLDTLGAGVRGLLENPALTRLQANRERPQPFGDYAAAQGSLWDQHGATGQAGGNLFAQAGLGGDPFAQGTRPVYGSAGSSYDRLARVASLALGHDSPLGAGVGKGAAVAATTAGATTPGLGATGTDPGTDAWRGLIDEAGTTYGIDPDAIQAVMMIESGGKQDARSPAGAMGLMQVMPFHFTGGENPFDPRTNVLKGASILSDNYKRYGSWDKAVAAYLGAIDAQGNITGGQDVLGTDGYEYAAMFNANLARIKAARQQQAPRPQGGGGGGTGMASIWGGGNAPITQDYGAVTPGIDQGIYGYGAVYGLPQGHTGLDIGVKRGTQLYLPTGLTGTVTTAGGTPYFRDEDYGDAGTPGKGELRITLSNGDILIMGHTSGINVGVGQQVAGGALLGQSGSASGDHLHLEYRRRNADGSYSLVDPRTVLGG